MKNYLLPILIIVIVGFLAVSVFLGQKIQQQGTSAVANNTQDSRLLSLKVPGMFCLGCSASVEGYLSAIDGVQSVNASLATKQVGVIYDSSVVSKDTILANQILDAYGKELLSDEPYTGGGQAKTPSTTYLPQGLALKLQNAAGKVSQLENPENYQDVFDKIDQAIAQENYQEAEDLVDGLLNQLQENE